MIKVQNNDIKSINAALLSIQNRIKSLNSGNNEVKETTVIRQSAGTTENNNNLEIEINNLNNRINSLVSNLEIINENLNTVTNKVNSLIPYPGNYIQSVEEAKKEAIEEAVAQSGEVDLSSLPHYIGPYDADNIPVNADCNKGDWYFNTTDIKLYINNYDTDTELYSWDEIPLTKENEYMYNSASKDILNYADDTGNIGTFATAYISHLFSQKITVTDSVQSSNYSDTEGFKLDGETGDIFANNGYFKGVIAKQVFLYGSKENLLPLDVITINLNELNNTIGKSIELKLFSYSKTIWELSGEHVENYEYLGTLILSYNKHANIVYTLPLYNRQIIRSNYNDIVGNINKCKVLEQNLNNIKLAYKYKDSEGYEYPCEGYIYGLVTNLS